MIYDKTAQVLLALDKRSFLYREPARCVSCEIQRVKQKRELHVMIYKSYSDCFWVCCSKHLEDYLNNGWELYE